MSGSWQGLNRKEMLRSRVLKDSYYSLKSKRALSHKIGHLDAELWESLLLS